MHQHRRKLLHKTKKLTQVKHPHKLVINNDAIRRRVSNFHLLPYTNSATPAIRSTPKVRIKQMPKCFSPKKRHQCGSYHHAPPWNHAQCLNYGEIKKNNSIINFSNVMIHDSWTLLGFSIQISTSFCNPLLTDSLPGQSCYLENASRDSGWPPRINGRMLARCFSNSTIFSTMVRITPVAVPISATARAFMKW